MRFLVLIRVFALHYTRPRFCFFWIAPPCSIPFYSKNLYSTFLFSYEQKSMHWKVAIFILILAHLFTCLISPFYAVFILTKNLPWICTFENNSHKLSLMFCMMNIKNNYYNMHRINVILVRIVYQFIAFDIIVFSTFSVNQKNTHHSAFFRILADTYSPVECRVTIRNV